MNTIRKFGWFVGFAALLVLAFLCDNAGAVLSHIGKTLERGGQMLHNYVFGESSAAPTYGANCNARPNKHICINVEGYDCKTNALQAYVEHQLLLIRDKAEQEHAHSAEADAIGRNAEDPLHALHPNMICRPPAYEASQPAHS